ncbi:MAG: hypothetical protein KatS3mg108_1541 [Isosphaeraceae bacterium]|jgi:predicted component of type VI protein secretion system|nr:MAG: hypothetical protein KatS3mg108_1541 [Isosphaeraceae bacterium]
MKTELIPLNGDPPIPIRRAITVLGRREDLCDETIRHPSLSKRHCVLVRTEGLLIIRDLISTNGTKVNGQRVSWAALMPNDRITLGRLKFKVYQGPDHLPAPSERQAAGRPPVAPTVGTFDHDELIPPELANRSESGRSRPPQVPGKRRRDVLDDPVGSDDSFRLK